MKKSVLKLIVHEDSDTKTGFSSRIKRDISVFSGVAGEMIILGLDETGKINVFVSDAGRTSANA